MQYIRPTLLRELHRLPSNGGMDEIKAGIQCRGMDIRKGRDVDVRNGREMVAGLNRKREDPTSP